MDICIQRAFYLLHGTNLLKSVTRPRRVGRPGSRFEVMEEGKGYSEKHASACLRGLLVLEMI